MSDEVARKIAKTWTTNLPVLKLTNEITPLGVVLNRFDLETAAPYLAAIVEASPEAAPPIAFFEQVFQHYQNRLKKIPGVLCNFDVGKQAFILNALKHFCYCICLQA
jgi:hypothetical protein